MADAQVQAVALKLPSFWSAQPAVWFQQAEAQFAVRGITAELTKYYYVIGALDQTTAGRLVDFLETPPTDNQYTALKTRLLATYALSRRDRASKILHMDSLGDRRPSVVMDELLSLMGNHSRCLLFEQVFLELLPPAIRIQLSDADFADPRAVAIKADGLWQIQQTINDNIGIHEVNSGEGSKVTVARVQQQRHQRSHQPCQKPLPLSSHPQWCFYHNSFGKNARKCQATASGGPCTFSENSMAGRQ